MPKRSLSLGQARRCEEATGARCRCRCGGALHGARRKPDESQEYDRAWFESLPEDDPHRLKPSKESEEQAERQERADQYQLALPFA